MSCDERCALTIYKCAFTSAFWRICPDAHFRAWAFLLIFQKLYHLNINNWIKRRRRIACVAKVISRQKAYIHMNIHMYISTHPCVCCNSIVHELRCYDTRDMTYFYVLQDSFPPKYQNAQAADCFCVWECMCVCVSVYVRLCDHNMWHDNMWHDVFLYGHNSVLQYMTRHIPMWTRLSPMCVMVAQYVTWLSPKTTCDTTIWDTTYSHMWHDSVLYVLWLSPMCGNSFLCITYMWHDSFRESWRFAFVSKCIWRVLCVSWLNITCGMTHSVSRGA